MKWLYALIAISVILLQYRLWVGEGSLAQVWQLNEQISAQQSENESLGARNAQLDAEVRDLKTGNAAIEERARSQMGMIRKDETFFLVIEE
ncbi:MAG: cell division protein FtsB [Hahellaceae bacterium]|nr:cell division protein FtsB [Hahellaceae bacterium]